jgi:OOP family OmpA-OmpF porin
MKKIASALLISAAISAPALAAEPGTGYFALDYGSWAMANASPFPNPGVLTFSGGYHFTENVGMEVGYAMVGDSTVNYGFGSTTIGNSALKFAAVGTLPVSPEFDVFGKVGIAMITGTLTDTFLGSYSATTNNVMFGIGGQFNMSRDMGIRFQYEKLGKTKAQTGATGLDVTSFSVGIVFGF